MPTVAKPIPQTEEEVAYHAQRYVVEDETVKQLDAEEAQELADVKQKYADRKQPHIEARDEHFAASHAWGEANRRDRKTIKLSNGRELRWRTASSAKLVLVGTLETVIQSLLKRRDWKKFLKVELKKASLAAHPKVVEDTVGLQLERGEYFSIG